MFGRKRFVVEVIWRSYQLDPYAPRQDTRSNTERLAQKYGVSLQQAEAMTQQERILERIVQIFVRNRAAYKTGV